MNISSPTQGTLPARPGLWHVMLFGVLVFFFVYAIAVKPLPSALYTARIIALFALGIFAIRVVLKHGNIRIPLDLGFVFLMYSLYFVWVVIRTVMTGVSDVSLLINSALFFLQVVPGAILLTALIRTRHFEFHHLIMTLHVVIVFQAVLILLTFISWDFRLWTLALLHEAASNVDPLHPYRVRGLTHNTGAALSAFQAMAFFFTPYLLFRYAKGPVFWYLCLSVPVVLGSVLMTGRAGFVGFGVAALATLWWLRVAPAKRGVVKAMLLVPVSGVLGYFALKGLYLMVGGREMPWGEDAFASMVRWVVSEFALYAESGTLSTGTVGNLLQNHWFLPASNSAFLLGDPRSWSYHRIDTDIGVLRMIFGAGFVGTALLYTAAASAFLVTRHYLTSALDRSLVTAVVLWMAIFELKEPSFMSLRMSSLLMLMLVFAVWSRYFVTPEYDAENRRGRLQAT